MYTVQTNPRERNPRIFFWRYFIHLVILRPQGDWSVFILIEGHYHLLSLRLRAQSDDPYTKYAQRYLSVLNEVKPLIIDPSCLLMMTTRLTFNHLVVLTDWKIWDSKLWAKFIRGMHLCWYTQFGDSLLLTTKSIFDGKEKREKRVSW